MELTYLLVGLGTFLAARVASASPKAGSSPKGDAPLKNLADNSSPPASPPKRDVTPPRGVRADIINRLYNGGIPNFDFVSYAFAISQPESGGKYRPFNQKAADRGYPLGLNQYGFAGIYQVGAQGLEDQGFIKAGTWATDGTGGNYEIFTNKSPSYWTSKCPNGIEQFLDTPELQEAAFIGFTLSHYRRLKAAGILTDASPASVKGGYLSAAHLKGMGGAKSLFRGRSTVDGNGTSTAYYYKIGANSQSSS